MWCSVADQDREASQAFDSLPPQPHSLSEVRIELIYVRALYHTTLHCLIDDDESPRTHFARLSSELLSRMCGWRNCDAKGRITPASELWSRTVRSLCIDWPRVPSPKCQALKRFNFGERNSGPLLPANPATAMAHTPKRLR